MLAPAAAGTVLDLDDVFHQVVRFCFSFSGGFCFSSSCYSLPDSRFRFGTYGPDKTQEFATYRCDDLSLVFARGSQSRVSLMQSVLRLPRNLFSLFRYALLSFARPSPDGRRTMITPCCFDDDPSQVRVARLRNAAAPGSLATGVLARHSVAITHQFSSTRKRETWPNSAAIVTAEMCAMPRNACKS